MIYFIGGASASGKSTVCKEIAVQEGLKIIELDQFYNALNNITNNEIREDATKKICEQLASTLCTANISIILEGGWIDPEISFTLQSQYKDIFFAIYCGYPNANLEDRFEEIKKSGEHWTCTILESEAKARLAKQIKGSGWYKEQCDKYDLPFIDFSNFENGSKEFKKCFKLIQQRMPNK